MIYFEKGSENHILSLNEIREGLTHAFSRLGSRNKVLAVPPDITRAHSFAGPVTEMAWEYYGEKMTDILPALGTHKAMTSGEIKKMYGAVPESLFRVHNWRDDVVTLGEVPSRFLHEISGGNVEYPWPVQVNRLLVEGGFDQILSIGQVVPHEVVGMANHSKNIFIGTGGPEGINKSHFLGAAYGMEKIMGRVKTPVRALLNYASEKFGNFLPPILYILTVIGRDSKGALVPRGLFIGDDEACFEKAAALSLKVNFEMVSEPLSKVIVYLDPEEYKSTWLGNKSIYRTRMAIADGGELIVLAPGVNTFGEDPEIDRLIRKYGYQSTMMILRYVNENRELKDMLGAAAHLIHGSSEGRFTITYCPGGLSEKEIELVNYQYADLTQMFEKYDPAKLVEGWNITADGEKIFFISNPATGLWSVKDKFHEG